MEKEAVKALIQEASDFRTAVRVYNDVSIPKEDMEFILDIAHQSPSSVGLEGWRFIVVDNHKMNADLKAELKAVSWGAQPQLETASHFVFLIAEKNARYDSEAMHQSLVRRGLSSEEDLQSRKKLYQSFQVNDMKIADDPRALFDWTAKQTYIAMGNMMTTAALLGIDTCPIEGFNQEKVNAILAKYHVINQEREGIATMVSFGYRLRDPKHPKTRKPREEVVTWIEE